MERHVGLDDLNRRLSAVHEALLALPAGPSSERYALLRRRDALREEAAAFRSKIDQERSTPDLRAELDALRKWRGRFVADHTGFATGGGGNDAPGSSAWVELGTRARGDRELAKVNARIAKLEDILGRREPASDSPSRDRQDRPPPPA